MGFGESLLAADEGQPAAVENEAGRGGFVIVCEHASRALPQALGDLGLSPEALSSHIAWDPGALALARLMSRHFDSPLVFQRFSRLAYDCNRPPESPGAMPDVSEIYTVPGNIGLSAEARDQRTRSLYLPFHKTISDLIDARLRDGLGVSVMTVHSFTPIYFGKPRDVQIGVLHDVDSRLADRMIAAAKRQPDYDLRRNEPYGPADGVTHSLQLHGVSRGLENVMIEVRNDLIRDSAGQEVMARYLSDVIAQAAAPASHEMAFKRNG